MNDAAPPRETPSPKTAALAGWRRLLLVALVIAVPAIAVGNALIVVVNPWFVDAQYALPGFPENQIGLDSDQRTALAKAGLDSVRPLGPGTVVLENARLPNGMPAFLPDEISHMDDVGSVIDGFMVAWLAGVILLAAASIGLVRTGRRDLVIPSLGRGALLTAVILALAGIIMLVNFDFAFTAFHGIFFTGDSWRFGDYDTLLQLYPDIFWGVAAGVMVFLILLQAAVVAWLWQRQRRPQA